MVEQRILLQPAYVLHSRPYRDTSALVELFSREHGRIGVVAKGVRNAKSRWRGVLQVFQPLLVSWNLRGELGTLTAVENQGAGRQMPASHIASGFYLNEILMRLLTRHDAHETLFDHYHTVVQNIAALHDGSSLAEARLEGLLRGFEIQLLAELGYGLVLDHDIDTGKPIQAGQAYYYYLERGPVMAVSDKRDEKRYSGRTLLTLAAGETLDADGRQEAKHLLRAVLSHYLGPKPLMSRELMRSLRVPAAPNSVIPTTPELNGATDHNVSH